MSQIAAYFKSSKETPSSLAAKCGVAHSTITRALRGERHPSVGLAQKVEKATNGEVTAKEFMAECMDAINKPKPSETDDAKLNEAAA